MRLLILSCSLSPKSRSAVLARAAAEEARRGGDEVELLDLREMDLPLCDADRCYAHPDLQRVQSAMAGADAIAVATPIYNYEVGGATRNLVALVGKGWTGKVVGFLCAAGGKGSYMAVMGLAQSLMLDFRCLIVPRYVFATGAAFTDRKLTDPELQDRVHRLVAELRRIGTALAAAPPID